MKCLGILVWAILLLPAMGWAKCEKGYALRERREISRYYINELAEVNRQRDERIAAAFERLASELPPQARAELEAANQDAAALAKEMNERKNAAHNRRGLQREYAAKKKEIFTDFREDSRELRARHKQRYNDEVYAAREEVKSYRQALSEMQQEEVEQLRAYVATGCKVTMKQRVRGAFDAMSDKIREGRPPAETPAYGGTGRRG